MEGDGRVRERIGGRLSEKLEGKQWRLATAPSRHINGIQPTFSYPAHIDQRAQPVQLSSFPKPFSSLFWNNVHSHCHPLNSSSSQKGILPFPTPISDLDQEAGWTQVINMKRFRQASRPQLPQPFSPPKKYSFCHKFDHMARDCPEGAFICFKCHGKGHTLEIALLLLDPSPPLLCLLFLQKP